MNKYIRKVAGGKLLAIKINIAQNRINKFQLLGDFFLYPEEKISLIEKSLIGLNQEAVDETLNELLSEEKITLMGISTSDISLLVSQAFKDYEKRGKATS